MWLQRKEIVRILFHDERRVCIRGGGGTCSFRNQRRMMGMILLPYASAKTQIVAIRDCLRP